MGASFVMMKVHPTQNSMAMAKITMPARWDRDSPVGLVHQAPCKERRQPQGEEAKDYPE